MQPLNVVAVDPARFDTPEGLANVKKLQALLAGDPARDHRPQLHRLAARQEDAERGRSTGDPGEGCPRRASTELRTGSTGRCGAGQDLQTAAAGLVDVYGYLTQLAQAYPDVLERSGLPEGLAALSELAKVAQALPDSRRRRRSGPPGTGGAGRNSRPSPAGSTR